MAVTPDTSRGLFRSFSLKVRITLVVVLIELVLVVALLWNNTVLVREQQIQQISKTADVIARQTQSIVGRALVEYDIAALQEFTDNVIKNQPVDYISIVNSNEKPYAASGTPPPATVDSHQAQHSTFDSPNKTVPIVVAGQTRGHAHINMSEKAMKRSLKNLYRRNAAIAIGFLILGVFVAIMTGRVLSKRLDRLTSAVLQYGTGNENVIIPVEGKDEISDLGHAIRKMVSDRAAALAAQVRSETNFRLIFENAQEGIFQVNADGNLINANPALAKILGYASVRDLLDSVNDIGEDLFFNTDDQSLCREDLRLTGRITGKEIPWKHREGRAVWVRLNLQIIKDARGEFDRIDGTAEDISERRLAQMELEKLNEELEMRIEERTHQLSQEVEERRRTEDALLEAKELADKANASKSRFLAKMSHELRTPLNAIIGFSDTMGVELFGPLGGEKYKEYTKHIHDSGVHLLALINDILDLSKIEANALEMADGRIQVSDSIERALGLISSQADKKKIVIETYIATRLPDLRGDQRRFQQILLNLLSNAVKYTPQDGRVTLTADIAPSGWMFIEVRDTGIGMASEDIPKAFVEFGQIKNPLMVSTEGTGLGLPLTRALVLRHDGRIHLESTLNEGTVATIEFPKKRFLDATEEDGSNPLDSAE